jgi:hypothetical protein
MLYQFVGIKRLVPYKTANKSSNAHFGTHFTAQSLEE